MGTLVCTRVEAAERAQRRWDVARMFVSSTGTSRAASFVSDPEVPPIMKEAGHKGKPQAAQLAVRCDA